MDRAQCCRRRFCALPAGGLFPPRNEILLPDWRYGLTWPWGNANFPPKFLIHGSILAVFSQYYCITQPAIVRAPVAAMPARSADRAARCEQIDRALRLSPLRSSLRNTASQSTAPAICPRRPAPPKRGLIPAAPVARDPPRTPPPGSSSTRPAVCRRVSLWLGPARSLPGPAASPGMRRLGNELCPRIPAAHRRTVASRLRGPARSSAACVQAALRVSGARRCGAARHRAHSPDRSVRIDLHCAAVLAVGEPERSRKTRLLYFHCRPHYNVPVSPDHNGSSRPASVPRTR